MALCSQMDNARHMFFLHQRVNRVEIADICTHETVVRFVLDIFEVRQVTCVCQLVHIDDTIVRVLVYKQTNHMTSDKSGSAGDDDTFTHNTYRICLK